MADLLSNTDKTSFQNSVLDLFDTFSRAITIHKEPQKKITQVDANLLPGYNNTSKPENVEYIHRSASYNAIIEYNKKQNTETEAHAGTIVSRGSVSIKVQQDARDYINNGKTEKIIIDDKSFNLASRDAVKDYFGMKMYIYFLEESS
jgi:hypothetical protein